MTTITISGQHGSAGRKISARVAELLGFQYFDKRLMVRLATEVGMSAGEIVDYTEEHYKVKNFRQRFAGLPPLPIVTQVSSVIRGGREEEPLSVDQLDEEVYVRLVNTLITGAYERGNVVILGRGGQALLKDKPDVLHVRLETPPETRLARIRESEGLSDQEARRFMKDRDEASARYMERYFQARLEDPFQYHLILNTGLCDTEQASHLIVEAARQLVGAVPV